MSWVKYVLKTSLKQKLADRKEYENLKRQVVDAACKVSEIKGSISYMCRPDESVAQGHACINYKLEPSKDAKSLNLETVYCPDFLTVQSASLCEHLHCPYLQKNREYHAACSKANTLRMAKRIFWAQKYAKVK